MLGAKGYNTFSVYKSPSQYNLLFFDEDLRCQKLIVFYSDFFVIHFKLRLPLNFRGKQ